jgi:hypothetical protein
MEICRGYLMNLIWGFPSYLGSQSWPRGQKNLRISLSPLKAISLLFHRQLRIKYLFKNSELCPCLSVVGWLNYYRHNHHWLGDLWTMEMYFFWQSRLGSGEVNFWVADHQLLSVSLHGGGTDPIHAGMVSSNPNCCPKAWLPNIITLWGTVSYEFWSIQMFIP